jgi:hypothetical protein
MVKCGVLFEVRTEFLNIFWTSFGFKGLNLNSVNQLIFVMVKGSVLFEVRTEFLNIIWTSFGFKWLNLNSVNQLILVMVRCGVLFEVRTEFLNIIWTSFVFKGLLILFLSISFLVYSTVSSALTELSSIYNPAATWKELDVCNYRYCKPVRLPGGT